MDADAVLHFDGACEPNPGLGAWGWTLDVPGRARGSGSGACLGTATNKVAEYTALGMGLRHALAQAAELVGRRLVVLGDSQLVIRQVRGEWQCRKPELARLRDRVLELCAGLEAAGLPPVAFDWVRREENAWADGLSVRAWEAAAGRPMPVRVKASKSRPPSPTLFTDAGPND